MLAELVAELPDGTVVTDLDIVASYRQDRASDPDAGTAIAVVRPRRTEEVQAVRRWATKHGVPVVPRGAGTGLSGGATALNGGIVLSTERMRDIFVDPVTRTAVTQPRCSPPTTPTRVRPSSRHAGSPSPRTRPSAPSWRSARSWIWPSVSAARSPASTALADSKNRGWPGYRGPEAMELNRRIKEALDPANVLNPGAAI